MWRGTTHENAGDTHMSAGGIVKSAPPTELESALIKIAKVHDLHVSVLLMDDKPTPLVTRNNWWLIAVSLIDGF
jgi:hypothetical protein